MKEKFFRREEIFQEVFETLVKRRRKQEREAETRPDRGGRD